VTLGRQLHRPELPTAGARWCEAALPAGSVYRFLARERARLFPPELFADLFEPTGRRSVPPSILAVVMVLQRLEGLSDREAADRFAFDVRWRYAAGVADAMAGEETASFAHTVLVDLRARLRRSADPDRIFRVTCQLARQVGLVGVRRVLDSAPLEDAVTTQDTVTMIRGAIRGLLRACPPELKTKVRAGLQRDDDYVAPGKPACDWTGRAAREALVDALVRDGYRVHYALRDQRLDPPVAEAAELLAAVTGQDIEETNDGRFRIFEGTAPDRVISTVDPQARHGHKTAAHGFDGYKGHIAADPDSEIITPEVSTATSGDAVVAPTLLGDLVPGEGEPTADGVVYGDSAYGTGVHLAWLEQQRLRSMVKAQLPTAPGGRFAKDHFRIDLQAQTVTCPARVTVAITPSRRGGGRARFGVACSVCPLRQACTSSVRGRVVAVHPHEAELAAARARQREPAWLADYRATRPKVERKLAHLLRRRHGGRRARVRGLVRVTQDFKLLAAAVNLARLAALGLRSTPSGWEVQPA
jgi:Transposase DDE domain/Transposase domain (DUF772)